MEETKNNEERIWGVFGPTYQGYDFLPWTDSQTVFLWDCKFTCSSSKEEKDLLRYPFTWVLVHSRQPDDVHRGLAMLRDSMENTSNPPTQPKKELYLLAVGTFRCRDYSQSEKYVDRCLEIKPSCWKSLFLKEVVVYRRKKLQTRMPLVDSATTSVEFVSGVLAATTSSHPTWGIEKAPNWMHPVTGKKYIQHIIEKTHRKPFQNNIKNDITALCIISVSAAVGAWLAGAISRHR